MAAQSRLNELLMQHHQQELCSNENDIMEMNYADEPCLALVYNFVEVERSNGNIKDDYRDNGRNYYCICAFCRDYILNKGIFEKLESHKNRERYDADYRVLASIQCYNKEYENQSDSERKEYTDQVWFLLQFLIYYIEALTSNRPKTMPPAKEQLQSFVDIVYRMDFFNKEDWINGHPKYTGDLVLEIKRDDIMKVEDKKIVISNSKILHLIALLIQNYINDERNKHAIDTIDDEVQLVKSKEGTLFEHYNEYLVKEDGWKIIHDKGSRTEEQQLIIDNIKEVLSKDQYERNKDELETTKIALLKHYIFKCLGSSAPLHKYVREYYPDYDNEKDIVNTGEWSLFSQMIYLLKYYPSNILERFRKEMNTCDPNSFNKKNNEATDEHEERVKKYIKTLCNNNILFKKTQTNQKKLLLDNFFNVLLELYYPSEKQNEASDDPFESVDNCMKRMNKDEIRNKYQINKTNTIQDLIEWNMIRKEKESSDEYGKRMKKLYDALLDMMVDSQVEEEFYDVVTTNDISIKNRTKEMVSKIDKEEIFILNNINPTRTLNI